MVMKLRSRHLKSRRCGLMTRNFGLLFLIACIGYSLSANEKEQASQGASTFKEKCVLCHGANGSGDTPLGKQLHADDLRSNKVQKMSDIELQKVVHDGRTDMPSFSDRLTNEE